MAKNLSLSIALWIPMLFLSCSDDEPSNDQLVPPLEEQLGTLTPQLLSDFNVNGIAVGYIKDGEILLKQGFGLADVSSQRAVTTQTIFNIGSVSKMFTGLGAMRLVRESELSLNKPIESFLNTWKLPPSAFDHSKVTLGRLLRHTGGTSIAGYPGYALGTTKPTIQESLSGMGSAGEAVRIIYDPGTQTQYSGGGISVIQLAIEETSGMSFSEFMISKMFNPLGMINTGFDYSPEVLTKIATPHGRSKNVVAHTDFTESGAAGMLSTLDDLVIFSLNIINEANGNTNNIPGIDSETIMMTLSAGREGSLQWQTAHQVRVINGVKIMGHIGTNNGWRCNLQIAPLEGHAIITMANGSSGGPDNAIICRWIREITGIVSDEFCG